VCVLSDCALHGHLCDSTAFLFLMLMRLLQQHHCSILCWMVLVAPCPRQCQAARLGKSMLQREMMRPAHVSSLLSVGQYTCIYRHSVLYYRKTSNTSPRLLLEQMAQTPRLATVNFFRVYTVYVIWKTKHLSFILSKQCLLLPRLTNFRHICKLPNSTWSSMFSFYEFIQTFLVYWLQSH